MGKSNLLEAVEFLSQLNSDRALNDKDLINNNSEYAAIFAQIDFNYDLKIDLFRKGPKKVFVNNSLLKKQSDVKKYIKSVCFNSNDINIVNGEPSFRRLWLDKVISQLEPIYMDLISRYKKLLKQRSHFWRSDISKGYSSKSLIDSFDYQLAEVGTRILRRRRRALYKLKPCIKYWHNYLSKSKENIGLTYLTSIKIDDHNDDEQDIRSQLIDKLYDQRNIEELSGKCMVGPHRDDISFFINDALVRNFGSSGQQRTITLALKLAELDLIKRSMSVDPILILDDVLAELDVVRQNLLLDSVGEQSQCFISATHLDKFNKNFVENSHIFYL